MNQQQQHKNSGHDYEIDYTLDDALAETEIRVGTIGEIRDADLARQIEHAKKNPRRLRRFRDKLTEYCTLSEEVASSCTYALPRGGKKVIGPSVRFAELVVAAYGNVHVGVTIIDVDDEAVVCHGYVLDLEENTRTEIPKRQRVTKKRDAKKADEDMKNLAVAVASSIAYRNAVFKAIPRALWEDIWHTSQEAATGKGTMQQRRAAAFALYAKFGASESQVLAALGRSGEEEVTNDDLRYLKGMVTSIRSGELTIEDALRPLGEEKPERAPLQKSPLASRLERPKPEPTPSREPGEDDK